MKPKEYMTWNTLHNLVKDIARFVRNKSRPGYKYIYGIPRGGVIPAVMLSHELDIPYLPIYDIRFPDNILVVDDVIDSGAACNHILSKNYIDVITLVRKPWSPMCTFSAYETDRWIVMPWENQ